MYSGIFNECSRGDWLTHSEIKIADPFAGDGRLIAWFIDEWFNLGYKNLTWEVFLFDTDSDGLELAEKRINELKEKNMFDYPVVLVNLISVETSDLEPILEFLEENDLNVIKIGLGNKITDFSSITALKNEVQKFI